MDKKLWIRTPLIYSKSLSQSAGCQIYLKLENIQPSGSFKSRGIGNYVLHHFKNSTAGVSPHFFSSSGGNAGIAAVCAAVTLGCPSTVVVPLSTSSFMINEIRKAGATDVVQEGESWVDADAYLRNILLPRAAEKGEKPVYVPPFDSPLIWEGNATIVDEVLDDLKSIGQPQPAALVCSVGGGGLFSGLMTGLDRLPSPHPHVVAVETHGADSLAQSLEKSEHITLPAITSIATTLGARKVGTSAFEFGQKPNVTSLVLEDRDAVYGCKALATEHRMLVEASCGVCIATCFEDRLKKCGKDLHLREESVVVIVVCGGSNMSAELLSEYCGRYL